ncbi:MAG: hypothetical protein Q8936_14995 [Bacillota bacterium]|nr:hypothetical protein [Bacillota bacterium]
MLMTEGLDFGKIVYRMYFTERGCMQINNREEILDTLYVERFASGKQIIREDINAFLDLFNIEVNTKFSQREAYMPSSEIVLIMTRYYGIIDNIFPENEAEEIKKKLNIYILLCVADATELKKFDYVHEIFSVVSNNPNMIKKLIENLIISEKFVGTILNWYIRHRIDRVKDIYELIDELKFWGEISIKILEGEFFRECFKDKMINIFDKNRDKIWTANIIYELFNQVTNNIQDFYTQRKFRKFFDFLVEEIYEKLIAAIDLSKLTLEDITELKFYDSKTNPEKNLALKCLKEILESKSLERIEEIEDKIYSLRSEYMFHVGILICEFYKNELSEENFRKVMCAFVRNKVYNTATLLYDFDGLLKFILDSGGEKKVYEFIVWIADNFKGLENDVSRTRFIAALENYFSRYDRRAFKDRESRKHLFSTKNKAIAEALKNIQGVLTGGIKGWFF